MKLRQSLVILMTGVSVLAFSQGLADDLYAQGLKGDNDRNYAVSFPAFKQAAENGDSRAYMKIANHYQYGKGTAKSFAKAKEWFIKAAEAGNGQGYHEIGYMHEEGIQAANHVLNSGDPMLGKEAIQRRRPDFFSVCKSAKP